MYLFRFSIIHVFVLA